MTINFSISKDIDIKQLEELYNDVGWSAYTQDLEVLNICKDTAQGIGWGAGDLCRDKLRIWKNG